MLSFIKNVGKNPIGENGKYMKNYILKNSVPAAYTRSASLVPPRCSFLIVICLLLIVLPLSAQEETSQPEDWWFSLGGELALYSPTTASFGMSLAGAYGSGTSIGMKLSWFFDIGQEMNTLEINILFRLYFYGKTAYSGPFAQFEGGPAIYFDVDEKLSFPARIGIANVGAVFGWRFLLGKYFFLEPSIRGGYPYIFGISVLAGVHFN